MPVGIVEVCYRQLRAVLGLKLRAEAFEIMLGQFPTMGSDGFDMGKLAQANRRCNVSHIELATQHIDIEPVETGAGNALQTIFLGQSRLVFIVQYQATAFG